MCARVTWSQIVGADIIRPPKVRFPFPVGRPLAARQPVSAALGIFRRLRTASFFLSDQKETKESPGAWVVGKSSAFGLRLSLPIPPDPLFTGESAAALALAAGAETS